MGAMNPALRITKDDLVNSGIFFTEPAGAKRIPTPIDEFAILFAEVLLNSIPIKGTRKDTEENGNNGESKNNYSRFHKLLIG